MRADGTSSFVALAPPAELVLPLFEEARAALAPAADWLRFPRPDGLHVTLAFLGALDAERQERVVCELRELGPRAAPRLVLGGAGAFPERGRERVLWLGAHPEAGDEERLDALAAGVHRAALAAGVEPGQGVPPLERVGAAALRLHLTAARVNGRRRPPGAAVPEGFWRLERRAAWRPAELVLFESRRQTEGPPRYVGVERWPLGG